MQANVPVPTLKYFQLLSASKSSNPVVPPAAETIQNSVHFEQDQISLHPWELLPEHVGDLDNQENLDPSSCQVVKELKRDRDRQNSGPGIISKFAVGIKKFWTEDSKNNILLNWLSLKIVNE